MCLSAYLSGVQDACLRVCVAPHTSGAILVPQQQCCARLPASFSISWLVSIRQSLAGHVECVSSGWRIEAQRCALTGCTQPVAGHRAISSICGHALRFRGFPEEQYGTSKTSRGFLALSAASHNLGVLVQSTGTLHLTSPSSPRREMAAKAADAVSKLLSKINRYSPDQCERTTWQAQTIAVLSEAASLVKQGYKAVREPPSPPAVPRVA